MEWCVFAMVALFVAGVVLFRAEITAAPDFGSTAPVQSLDE